MSGSPQEDLNITSEMDQKPAADPALAAPPASDTDLLQPQENPSATAEDINQNFNSEPNDQVPPPSPPPEEINKTMADKMKGQLNNNNDVDMKVNEGGAKEIFLDEEQPAVEAAENNAMSPPQPNLKDPPPAAAPAEATQADAANGDALTAASASPPPAGMRNEEKQAASIGGAGAATMKSPPPPAVEPKDVQEAPATKEKGDGDAEEGGAAAQKTGAGGEKPKPKTEGSKREINRDFKDVHETGSWGGISTTEKVIVGVVALLILGGVIAAVVVVLGQDDGPKEELVPAATQAPTPMATSMPADEKFPLLMEEILSNPVTAPLADTLSQDPSSYVGLSQNEAACAETPSECAMSWALHTDEFIPEGNRIVDRFALAAVYYSLGGPNWNNNTNWLTTASICEWHGVNCNRLETEVEELDLGENGLQGEIPVELSLIDTVAVMSMKQNEISGELPGEVLAALPKLFVLYMQNNLLSGPIPDNLVNEEESLALLFIQGNNFTGPFPAAYCGDDGASPVFRQFSLDCNEKNECGIECCNPSDNCF